MKEWIENVVKTMSFHPDEVSVDVVEGVVSVVYTTQANEEDLQYFRNEGDRFVRAFNSVLSMAGAKTRKRHVIKFNG